MTSAIMGTKSTAGTKPVIRQSKPSDVKKIVQLGKDALKERWFSPMVLHSVLKWNPKTCWVLELDGWVIGARFVFDDKPRAWGWGVVIHPNFRRQGYGRMLFEQTNKKLKKMGYRILLSEQNVENRASIEWHKRVGFRQIAAIPKFHDRGEAAALFYYEL